jgi:hypothetical protein
LIYATPGRTSSERGVKISVIKAEISVNIEKAANWFAATMCAITTMITPEVKVPDEVKH